METRVRERADVSAILLPIMSYRAYTARLQANKNAIHRNVKTVSLLADYHTGAPITSHGSQAHLR